MWLKIGGIDSSGDEQKNEKKVLFKEIEIEIEIDR